MENRTGDASLSQVSSEWVRLTGDLNKTRNAADATANAAPQRGKDGTESPPARKRRREKERSRVSRACDRCKKKKIRCTGRCPCALCMVTNQPCEYTASYTRGRLPSIIIDDNESALAAGINTQTHASLSTAVSLPDTASDISTPSVLPNAASRPHVEAPPTPTVFAQGDQIVTKDESSAGTSPEPAQTDLQGHYVGPASGVSFLLRIQKTLHQNSQVSHDSSIFTFGDAPLPEFDPTFFVMPPKAEGQKLVDRYFDFAAPTHRFLHRPTIEGLMTEFYETQGDMRNREEAPGKTALLLIVMAQAKAYMPEEDAHDSSARYYFASEHQLSKERGATRLASVQARLGQCFFLLTQSRINHCWSLFGTLAHLAFAIGLNRGRSCNPSTAIDYVELESRRRLFWVAYVLDKYLAAALGRPRTFKDEDIDQELPTVIHDSDLTPTSMNTTRPLNLPIMYAPIEHIKLSQILSHVLRDLYPIRPPLPAQRLALAEKYTADLSAWRAANAHFLDSTNLPSNLLIPIYQRQRNVLNLAYYHAVILVHRPFLLSNFASLTHFDSAHHFHTQSHHHARQTHQHSPHRRASIATATATAPETTTPSSPHTSDSASNVHHCLTAALGIVHVVTNDLAGSQVFRALWFTQYYAFCAVVVLYIYRIQQGIFEPGVCEGYYAAGRRCQSVLESISGRDSLSKRYCLVLEELRREAAKVSGNREIRATAGEGGMAGLAGTGTGNGTGTGAPSESVSAAAGTATGSAPGTAAYAAPYYGAADGMMPGLPTAAESAMFGGSAGWPSSSMMADLTSWGQFDSLVTAGIGGMFDGGGYAGDQGLGYAFGLGG